MSGETFEHQIAFVSARISIEASNSAGTSIGTGFFYKALLNDGTDRFIILLISNKHVFLDPKGTLNIILNRKNAEGKPDYGNVESFASVNFEDAYFAHLDTNVDLACVNVTTISYSDVFYLNLSDDFLSEIDHKKISPGTDVMFVGYPENRYDVVNNLPLIRKGSIASVPEVDFNGKGQIVIDAQVFQGSSGSPVFVAIDGHMALLGVISETMIRHAQLQTLPANLSQVGVQQMIGLGIIIKQRHVKELIKDAVSEFIRRNLSA